MKTYTGHNVNDVYAQAIFSVMREGAIVPSRVSTTREIHPGIFEIADPTQRIVSAYGRPINVAFAMAEVLWILSGRDDVNMLEFYNSTIGNYSDDGQTFNAAYGARLRNGAIDQIEHAIQTLKADPDSRQVTLVISDPWRDRTWSPDGRKHETKDRACNVLSHLMIREGRLDWLQIVRSNDAMWGTPYNWIQFTCIQEWIAGMIGVPVGRYIHIADSLHVYDYHWDEARSITSFDLYDYLPEHAAMLPSPGLLERVSELEAFIRLESPNFKLIPQGIPLFWQQCLMLWAAHAMYKEGRDADAFNLLKRTDAVMGASMIRFYFHHRWSKADYDFWREIILMELPHGVAEWIIDHAQSDS